MDREKYSCLDLLETFNSISKVWASVLHDSLATSTACFQNYVSAEIWNCIKAKRINRVALDKSLETPYLNKKLIWVN